MSRSTQDEIEVDIALFTKKKPNPQKPIHMKVVIVGDGAVGKTCFLLSYCNNGFPYDYMPNIWDNFQAHVTYENMIYDMALWDTAGQDDYDRLRPLSYPETNVFLICFSLVDPTSYENVKTKWVNEINEHCPNTPYMLIGMKKDLRDDVETIRMMSERNEEPVTKSKGIELAKEIKAFGYLECSAKTQKGLKEVAESCCRIQMFVEFLTVKKRRFFGLFKKKYKSGGNQVIWDKSNDDLRKIIATAEKKRFIELKRNIEDSIKSDKQLYKKYYHRLSRDIVKHILYEFVLIDFKALYEFHPNYEYFLQDLGFKVEDITQKFFGYFKGERKLIQLFYCFKIYENHHYRYLPKQKKLLMISNRKDDGIMKFKHYYSENILILDLIDVKVEEFNKMKKFCQNTLKKLKLITMTVSDKTCKDINQCFNLEELEISSNSNTQNINFGGDIMLKNLKHLVLKNIFSYKISFDKLENLEYLKLNVKHMIQEIQFKNIIQIKSLTKLVLMNANLSNIEYILDCIVLKKNILHIILHECGFNFSCLEYFDFEKNKMLVFFGVVKSKLNQVFGVDYFPKKFIANIKKRKSLKYYLEARNENYKNIKDLSHWM